MDIPIIASLTHQRSRLADFELDAERGQGHRADILLPTAMDRTGAQIEEQYLDVVARVKSAVTIPVAVKVGPYFSSFAHMAGRLDRAGADALVLFNRFYQPDFDIETREVVPSLTLSRPEEIRLPLLWIALLHGRVKASLAATPVCTARSCAQRNLMAPGSRSPAFVRGTRLPMIQEGSRSSSQQSPNEMRDSQAWDTQGVWIRSGFACSHAPAGEPIPSGGLVRGNIRPVPETPHVNLTTSGGRNQPTGAAAADRTGRRRSDGRQRWQWPTR